MAGRRGGDRGESDPRSAVCNPGLHMSASTDVQARELPKSWRPQPRRMARHLPTSPTERPDPEDSAKAAGLRYTTDATPGITRRPAGSGFTYLKPDGRV